MTRDEAKVLELIQELKNDPRAEGHGVITVRITDGKCVFVRIERDVKIQADN